MKHNIDFFRDEIRNGFYIPTIIKQSWACVLDVLSEIDRICKKHDIAYFADWGSFLGAVRHGGFIPWDDDLDICMKRDDYIKFRAVADSELPAEYCIHDYERHDNHWLFLSRVVNSSRICFDENYLNSHYNFPWLSGVDIFVKDYLYKDSTQEKERCDEVMFILAIAEKVISGNANPESLNFNLDKLEKKYSFKFKTREMGRELAISLYRLAEKQMARAPKEDSERVCQLFPWGLKGNPGEPKEYYENPLLLPFEDTLIPVPSHFNESLAAHYGDYNVIRKGTGGHDYPPFEGQRKNFEEATGMKLPRFTFDAAFLNVERPDSATAKRRVLFLPVGPKEWAGMAGIYAKESSRKDTEILVVPLPLMPKNCLGEITLNDSEILAATHLNEYPSSLPIMSWEDYDLEQHKPDTIYIQSPYDAENPYLTVPPYYYAENLIFYTKELVYIPIGPVADFNDDSIPDLKVMDFYVTMPGVILADKIYLHSETLQAHYINKLTSFTGDESTRAIWKSRTMVIPDLYLPEDSAAQISSSYETPTQPASANPRKHFLYCISSYEYFEHPDCFESAVQKRLSLLKESSDKLDVSVCLYPPCSNPAAVDGSQSNTVPNDDFAAKVCPLASAAGFSMVSFDPRDCEAFASRFDAYYGSSSPIVPVFVAQKKPVMIAHYELDV